MRVAFFVTCLMDQFFAEAALDTYRLLKSLGLEVDFPKSQTCCGQPAYNAGYQEPALVMARPTIGVLDNYEYVVIPSGSCTTMVRKFYLELFRESPREFARASDLATRTYELAEFLVEVLEIHDLGQGLSGKEVAYHQGCHALRELGIRNAPQQLLQNSGLSLINWPAEQDCCGFGGLFAAKLPVVSVAMADQKISDLAPGTLLTSADAGCLLQLSARAHQTKSELRFLPLASLLWQIRKSSLGLV